MKKLLSVVFGAAALACSVNVLADPTNVPRANARERLAENAARNPDARGLQNAQARLAGNDQRQSTRGRNQAPGQQKRTTRGAGSNHGVARLERNQPVERVERVEKVERVERPERVERVERPERVERAERVERVERPARPERVERPERPGKK